MKLLISPACVLPLLFVLMEVITAHSLAARAAGAGGTIGGTVVDPSGALVAGAQVLVTNATTGYKQTTKSGAHGDFDLQTFLKTNTVWK